MIKANENQFPVGMMCRMVSVSRSGYYDWKHRPPSDRDKANQLLANKIKRVFDDEKGRPGSPRITQRLQEEGKSVSRHRVARIMRDNGWRAKAAKKFKATKLKPFMVSGFRLDQMQSIKCLNILRCITIAKGFIPN